jgi:ribose transport system permease protein
MSATFSSSSAREGKRALPGWLVERLFLGIVIVIAFIAFSLQNPVMLSTGNISNVLIQWSYLFIFTAAQSLVIITRGFDLSLGGSISTISVVCALAMTATMGSVSAGLAVALLASAAIGLANGSLIAFARINPFIATLGTMHILLTLSTTLSGGFPVANLPGAFTALAHARILGIPLSVMVAVLLLVGLQLMLVYTVFGRSLYIIGSNVRAAIAAGLPHRRYLTFAYILCSMLIGIGAFLMTARTGSGEPNLGGNLTLETIAAAVLGGMRLRGGEGDMIAPLMGALLVTVLSNGMNLIGLDGYLQLIVLGAIIVLALSIDQLRGRGRF